MYLFSQILQYAISGLTAAASMGSSEYAGPWSISSPRSSISRQANSSCSGHAYLGPACGRSGLLPASLFAVAGTIVIAVVIERVAIRPVRFPSEMTYMMITIALASVIKGVVMLSGAPRRERSNLFSARGSSSSSVLLSRPR